MSERDSRQDTHSPQIHSQATPPSKSSVLTTENPHSCDQPPRDTKQNDSRNAQPSHTHIHTKNQAQQKSKAPTLRSKETNTTTTTKKPKGHDETNTKLWEPQKTQQAENDVTKPNCTQPTSTRSEGGREGESQEVSNTYSIHSCTFLFTSIHSSS